MYMYMYCTCTSHDTLLTEDFSEREIPAQYNHHLEFPLVPYHAPEHSKHFEEILLTPRDEDDKYYQ